MSNKTLILLFLIFQLSAQLAVSENKTHLPDLIQDAFDNNPAIQSAKAQWAQSIERYPQATSLDDPIFNVSYYIENVETRVGPQNYTVGITQKFPFPGTLRQKGRVVEKDIQIAALQYEISVRNVIEELKEAVYEFQYLDSAIEITRQNQTLLQEILSLAQVQYADQESPLNDVFRAESQLAQLDYDLITIRELRVIQQSVINSILNQPPDTPIGAIAAPQPQEATFTIQQLDNLVLNRNQEIRLAHLGVEKSVESIRLAKQRNLPSFSIGANFIDTGHALNRNTLDSGKDPIILSGGISIPLWSGKNKARVRYAESGKTAAEHQQSSIANKTQVDLRKIFFKLQNAQRLVALYRDHLIPQAAHSMQIAEEWNRTQKGSLSEILEVQSVWLNFNLAWLRAQTDYAQNLAQLERLLGGSLTSEEMEQ